MRINPKQTRFTLKEEKELIFVLVKASFYPFLTEPQKRILKNIYWKFIQNKKTLETPEFESFIDVLCDLQEEQFIQDLKINDVGNLGSYYIIGDRKKNSDKYLKNKAKRDTKRMTHFNTALSNAKRTIDQFNQCLTLNDIEIRELYETVGRQHASIESLKLLVTDLQSQITKLQNSVTKPKLKIIE